MVRKINHIPLILKLVKADYQEFVPGGPRGTQETRLHYTVVIPRGSHKTDDWSFKYIAAEYVALASRAKCLEFL